VTSMPTRRSAAAVASPPIPAPMIATESLFTRVRLDVGIVFPKGSETVATFYLACSVLAGTLTAANLSNSTL
jgi:hypothetical protein